MGNGTEFPVFNHEVVYINNGLTDRCSRMWKRTSEKRRYQLLDLDLTRTSCAHPTRFEYDRNAEPIELDSALSSIHLFVGWLGGYGN